MINSSLFHLPIMDGLFKKEHDNGGCWIIAQNSFLVVVFPWYPY